MTQYSFLMNALFGALLSGFSLALFAPYVTLRKISYMGEALSHIAFAGIAIALLTGLDLNLTSMIFVVAVSLIIGHLAHKRRLDESNSITIFLSVSMALGIILISLRRSYTFDLASYLFGNVLLVDGSDLIRLGILSIVNCLFIILYYKELFYLTYNAEISRVFRIPVIPVNLRFLALLACNIVINLKTAGIILVSAQLILPAAIAANLSRNFKHCLLYSVLSALISALGGFALSWYFNLPTGASIVMFEFALYLSSLFFRKR